MAIPTQQDGGWLWSERLVFRPCFHLSIPAYDLEASQHWYVSGLGCRPGRRSPDAAILDLAGHQLVLQRTPSSSRVPLQKGIYPRHFGLVLDSAALWQQWLDQARRAGLTFGVEPKCRFAGLVLEHHTFFLIDPSENWLEFKHYSQPEAALGCQEHTLVGDAELR